MLEEQLDTVDSEESRVLFLGSCRKDRNAARQHILTELDSSLAKYGMNFI